MPNNKHTSQTNPHTHVTLITLSHLTNTLTCIPLTSTVTHLFSHNIH